MIRHGKITSEGYMVLEIKQVSHNNRMQWIGKTKKSRTAPTVWYMWSMGNCARKLNSILKTNDTWTS